MSGVMVVAGKSITYGDRISVTTMNGKMFNGAVYGFFGPWTSDEECGFELRADNGIVFFFPESDVASIEKAQDQ